jgi:hypothetical protein
VGLSTWTGQFKPTLRSAPCRRSPIPAPERTSSQSQAWAARHRR